MCKHNDYEKRVEEHARREAKDTKDEESVMIQDTYSDEELLENGVLKLAEELEVRLWPCM